VVALTNRSSRRQI